MLVLLAVCHSSSATPNTTTANSRDDTVRTMTDAAQALTTAHDTVGKQFATRRFGNIVVEPATDRYQVSFIELPRPGQDRKLSRSVVSIERRSGRVVDVTDLPLPADPYQALDIPDATITGKQAFDAAVAAIKGYETYDKEGRLTVELVAENYQVTFPLPAGQRQPRGADYAFQVWINSQTAKVTKILAAS
jgi:hypothetical protein